MLFCATRCQSEATGVALRVPIIAVCDDKRIVTLYNLMLAKGYRGGLSEKD